MNIFDPIILFEKISTCVENVSAELRVISSAIWNRPETAYEEHFAHDILTAFLESKHFLVEKSFLLPTAFRAEFRSKNFDANRHPTVAFMSEYDSLPEIGHACGHNLIAICGLASALAVRSLLDDIEGLEGRVICMGTPAEETTGGKIDLLNGHAFSGVDFCLMAHPHGVNISKPTILGLLECEVEFFGIGADYGNEPWNRSASATDAAVLLHTSLSLLRQKLQPGNQIHGVIFEAGKPQLTNQAYAKCHYYMRTPTVPDMDQLVRKFEQALQGAALLSECTFKTSYAAVPFEGLISNSVIADQYEHYARQLGLDFPDVPPSYGSTDMGNISNNIPSLHTFYSIGDPTLILHTADFQKAAGTSSAHDATMNVSKALAIAGALLLSDCQLAETAKTEFSKSPASCFKHSVI